MLLLSLGQKTTENLFSLSPSQPDPLSHSLEEGGSSENRPAMTHSTSCLFNRRKAGGGGRKREKITTFCKFQTPRKE
jgi:hypothetical protein